MRKWGRLLWDLKTISFSSQSNQHTNLTVNNDMLKAKRTITICFKK